jgi:O-antigen ligase
MVVLAATGWITIITSISTVLITGYLPGTRLQVFDANANGLGIIALIMLPGILWKTIRSRKSGKAHHYLLAIVYIILAIFLIALSGSRGSAISFIVTVLSFLFFRRTRPWAYLCLSLLVLASIFTAFIFTTTLERFSGASGETTLGGREALWHSALDLIKDHPWVGVGIGNSSTAVMSYLRKYRGLTEFSSSSIHNPLLVILVDTGIPGLILYLGILASSVYSAIRSVYFCHKTRLTIVTNYYSLAIPVFLGYIASWIKGGGLEADFSYFLVLALLIIPSYLDVSCRSQEN